MFQNVHGFIAHKMETNLKQTKIVESGMGIKIQTPWSYIVCC